MLYNSRRTSRPAFSAVRGGLKLALVAVVWLVALGVLMLWLADRRVTYLSIAAGPHRSESFELATAIARVFEARYPNIDVEIYETQGSGENLRLLEEGRVDLATLQADSRVSHDVRALATLYHDAYQLIVRESSGTDTVADLAGQRIAIPPRDSGQDESFWFVVNHYGIGQDDVIALPMSDEAANFAMRQGQVDAVFRVRAPGNALVSELIQHRGDIELIPIDQPGALALGNPTIGPGLIPRGSYRGSPPAPPEDLVTAVLSRLLVAREGLDENLVYDMTRMLFEQRSALVAESHLAGLIRSLGNETGIAIPMHAGARRYYDREKPSVFQENSRMLAALLYVVAILTSAFLALRGRVKRSRHIRMKDYNLELMSIAEAVEQAQPDADLQDHKTRLVRILREVVRDLDAERVTQEEFDHFSFTWQAVDTLVRDRSGPAEQARR